MPLQYKICIILFIKFQSFVFYKLFYLQKQIKEDKILYLHSYLHAAAGCCNFAKVEVKIKKQVCFSSNLFCFIYIYLLNTKKIKQTQQQHSAQRAEDQWTLCSLLLLLQLQLQQQNQLQQQKQQQHRRAPQTQQLLLLQLRQTPEKKQLPGAAQQNLSRST